MSCTKCLTLLEGYSSCDKNKQRYFLPFSCRKITLLFAPNFFGCFCSTLASALTTLAHDSCDVNLPV